LFIGVPRETASGEKRVALVPEVVPQLVRAGHRVIVERDAGMRAGFTDEAYSSAGAWIVESAQEIYSDAQMILKVQRPGREENSGEAELDMLKEGTVLIGLLQPGADPALFQQLAERGIIACSMELVPRPTRAQMMDALSSQSTDAG
jgi:NAD(P) transhydrogenase subunit alpha